MGLLSYARYFVGLLLALEIVRIWFDGRQLTTTAIFLSVAFLFLAFSFIFERMGIINI